MVGSPSHFMSLLGTFLNFVFRNVSCNEGSHSYTWFQQAGGPGCSPRAAPVPGRLVCASVSMIRPRHTGPPLACERESKGTPFPRQPVYSDAGSLASYLPVLCTRSLVSQVLSLAFAGEKVTGHQRIDLAVWGSIG